MNLYKIHADSLKAYQAEQGDDCPVMFYNGTSIQILPGGALFATDNSPGGNSFNADLQLTCLIADFGDGFDIRSLNQQQINYPGEQGNAYRVKTITPAPNGYQVRLLCDDIAEGL